MKVQNTSRRVIKLLNGKKKVALIPGTGEVYEVTDCADVQYYIELGELTEVSARQGRKPARVVEEETEKDE